MENKYIRIMIEKNYIALVAKINYKKFEYYYVFENNYNEESLKNIFHLEL